MAGLRRDSGTAGLRRDSGMAGLRRDSGTAGLRRDSGMAGLRRDSGMDELKWDSGWLAGLTLSSFQHITDGLSTRCMSSLHKQIQQVPICSSEPMFITPNPQSFSPIHSARFNATFQNQTHFLTSVV